MKNVPKRYDLILPLIARTKPQTIVEVGTWSGDRAMQFAIEALKHQEKVHYIGYDLFEDATPETDAEELNVKKHFSVDQVNERLRRFRAKHRAQHRFTWELIKGNTRQTLKPQSVDFAYIDGGHSVETIQSDYNALQGSKVIVFDDYYLPDDEGNLPDVERFGANKIVDQLDAQVMQNVGDRVKEGGYVTIAVYPKR